MQSEADAVRDGGDRLRFDNSEPRGHSISAPTRHFRLAPKRSRSGTGTVLSLNARSAVPSDLKPSEIEID